ncbi:hypothetical protein ACFLX7_04210 [Chloroflexota bacterium]
MGKLESIINLRLALNRILSGQNYGYRNLRDSGLDAFAWASEDNLVQLRKEIPHTFIPSESTKVLLPKLSGLVRPITPLRFRDEVVYQAIGG